jgi:mannosyltransferase
VNDSARSAFHTKRIQVGLLLLILILALGLRFYRLDAQSLWNDEGTSVAIAQRDLATIARDAAHDIHPPLYYWLLHGWVRLMGTSEAGVRSLSALLGVILVALTYLLGRMLAGRWAGLLAALLAAANPFQVYYSQEARMYILLAVWSALAFYAALRWATSPSSGEGTGKGEDNAQPSPPKKIGSSSRLGWGAVYVLAATAGLYTHYAFAIVLLAINLVVLLDMGLRRPRGATTNRHPETAKLVEAAYGEGDSSSPTLSARRFIARPVLYWLALQAALVLLFLPWLPIAIRQLTTWPRVADSFDLVTALAKTGAMLLIGAPDSGGAGLLMLFFLLLFSLLPLLGWKLEPSEVGLSEPVAYLVPVIWVVLPIAAIMGLGLFQDAYLKFLLVASPASCLLIGHALTAIPQRRPPLAGGHPRWNLLAVLSHNVSLNLGRFAVLLLFGIWSTLGLGAYYTDPAYARDDYRAIAAYVDAVGRPGDVIVLNAPGQQEVFGYYYHGDLPVYPLPESRPLDPATTGAALDGLARPGSRVFAVLWATDESDPQRFIEGWLDGHAFKALDSWYGNVRLVVYAVPERTPSTPDHTLSVPLHNAETGDQITLLGYSLLGDRLAAGDIAQLTLFWQAGQTPTRRYKVFVHVLDENNHIVGQRDAEPGGGTSLTTFWQAGQTVADNYGVPIHPATPPGSYRVEVGMYSLETGQRLVTPAGESQVWLEPLAIERPSAPPPAAALGIQHVEGAAFGAVTLLGYDVYKLGFAHQPDIPLRPGDILHANLYWRAAMQPEGDWGLEIAWVDSNGRQWANAGAELVPGYPTSVWQAGDVWRGQFNLPIPAGAPPGRYRLQIQPIAPGGSKLEPFLTEPLGVAH